MSRERGWRGWRGWRAVAGVDCTGACGGDHGCGEDLPEDPRCTQPADAADGGGVLRPDTDDPAGDSRERRRSGYHRRAGGRSADGDTAGRAAPGRDRAGGGHAGGSCGPGGDRTRASHATGGSCATGGDRTGAPHATGRRRADRGPGTTTV